ncbi:MAG: arginine N-succinyltransferase [Gammaproteobacteria bacterium]
MANMNTETTEVKNTNKKRGFDTLHVFLMVALAIIVTALIAVWVFRTYLFPKEFKPVALTQQEEQVLDRKLEKLGLPVSSTTPGEPLQPERYSEAGAKREVVFSEREVNALMAKNTDLADKLVIDLSDDLVSAKLLVPLDEDFPIMGGKTLKVKAGIGLAYRENKPIVILKGVSIMGVPIPNAWLGNLKNIDLIEQYGGNEGFWKSFADGVDQLVVEEGELKIKLKE